MKERQLDTWSNFLQGFKADGYTDYAGVKYEKAFSEGPNGTVGAIKVTTPTGDVSIHPCDNTTDMCMEDTAWNLMRKEFRPIIPDKTSKSAVRTSLGREVPNDAGMSMQVS